MNLEVITFITVMLRTVCILGVIVLGRLFSYNYVVRHLPQKWINFFWAVYYSSFLLGIFSFFEVILLK
jgi:hypothetical protein